MPAIRIADIPNAPSNFSASGINFQAPRQIGLGSLSMGSIAGAAQSPSVNSPNLGSIDIATPQYAQLGQAAAADPSAMIAPARQMQMQQLNPDDFNASAKILNGMAKSIQLAGQVSDDWTDKFLEAKNSADIARSETFLRSVYEKQLSDQTGTPPEKWEEIWNDNLEIARKGLAEMKISPMVRDATQVTFQRWQDISTYEIARKARNEQISGMRKDMEANALMKAAKGDYEGSIMTINQSVKKGLHSEAEGNLFVAKLSDDMARQSKTEREAVLHQDIILDPIGSEKEAQEAVKTGKSSKYSWMNQSDAVRFFEKSRAEAARYRNQFDDDTVDLILKGQLTTPVEVREHAKDVLPENKIQSLLGIFAKTPAQIEQGLKMRPSAYSLADSYDPRKDDQNRSKYFATRDTILLLPEGEREEPLSILRKRANESGETTPVKQAVSQMNEMLDAGQFGKWQKGEDKKPLNDAEWDNYIAAGKRFSDQKIALENWAKNNPKEASDPEKVFDKLNKNLTYERQFQKFREEKDRPRWWWESPSKLTPPVPPLEADDALKKIRSKSSLNKNSLQKEIDDEAALPTDFETPLPEMTLS